MTPKCNTFIDSTELTKWVKWFLYLQIGMDIIALIFGAFKFQLLNDFTTGIYTSEAQIGFAMKRMYFKEQIIGYSQFVIIIITGILILKWIYRANFNIRQLGASNLQFTPGWSIGWYFAPFANLWKPYQAMKEIWKASINPQEWKSQPIPSLLGWWWCFWIITNMLGNASVRMNLKANHIAEYASADFVAMFSDLSDIPLSLIFLAMVNRIYEMQMSHWKSNTVVSIKNKSEPLFNSEERYWEQASLELKHGNCKEGVWAKAFANANGDEAVAKANYLKMRVSQLQDSDSGQLVKFDGNDANDLYFQANELYNQGCYAEALPLYLQLGNQGYINAQKNLGWLYISGQGVAQNYNEAFTWYRKAAEQGDADAQTNLGLMYFNGDGVAQNDKQAAYWYQKAAEQGHAKAQNNLGAMYQYGRGMPQDYAQALMLYRKAAEQGYALAQSHLGEMYRDGLGIAQDYTQALAWYSKAAEQGEPTAQSLLGWMYVNGLGVAQDYSQAVSWFRMAAEQGLAYAQKNLGRLLLNGLGVALDYNEAFTWYRKAAEQGDANAQTNLGLMYINPNNPLAT